jgi:ligand-binding sensor domain-containing protein/two-component sensor histidine kinase
MYPFEHFNEQNGLTAPVRKIVQDQLGFIWLGTSDGLFRYDGKTFKVFRNKLGDSTSIANNIINDLCVHPNGRIWIASNGGLCYYDYSDNYFHQVTLPENLEEADRYRVHSVITDYFGQIWFTTKTSAHQLSDDCHISQSLKLPFTTNYSITKIYPDHHNRCYIGTNHGVLVRIDLCTGHVQSLRIESRESVRLNLLTTIMEISPYVADTLLIASWYGGLHKVYFTDSSEISIPISNSLENDLQKNVVTGIAMVKPDLWWAVTQGSGIFFFDPVHECYLKQIKHNNLNPTGLSDNYISDVFVDNSGIIWIGTDDGLNKYDRLSHQFFSLSIPVQKMENSIYRRPSCILEDINDEQGKYLWITVPGVGLFHYDRKQHSFEYTPLIYSNKTSEVENRVYDMCYNEANQLVLSLASGIYYYNEKVKKLDPFFSGSVGNVTNVRELLQDKKGNYWFTVATNGIYKYMPEVDTLIHYSYQPDNPNSLPDNSVFCVMEDHDGFIWIGMQNRGLSRLNPNDGKFLHFEHRKMQARTLPDNNVNDLYEDSAHYLWIATENGLARLNPARNEFKIFTTSEGLSNNDIFFITPDKTGRLWLGTNNGLCVLNPADGSIINYSQMDGLPTNRIDGATLCCSDGALYFGTTSMISGCNPYSLVKNKRNPKVYITGLKVHGEEISLSRNSYKLKDVHLNYNENNFSAEFIALNYTNSAKNKYAYILEGYDNHWMYCGGLTTSTYTNLSGGRYTFRVKAANNDGVWSSTDDTLVIFIQPPFWSTWWFYMAVALSLFLLIYVYFKIKIRQILNLQRLRLDIARDLHDDVGSTLSSIHMTSSMPEQLIKSGKNQHEVFEIIQSASRKAMEMMNDIVWSIKPENDKPEMMLNRMRQFASEILEPAGIEFRFDVEVKSYSIFVPLRIRKDLFMIFKEALNNLAKYSKANLANIRLVLEKSELKLSIEDNGIGFDKLSIQKGNGLKNMAERARAIGATYNLDTGPDQGTRIELNLKF